MNYNYNQSINNNDNNKNSFLIPILIALFISLIIICSFFFIAVFKKGHKKQEKTDFTRTIMIYMVGSDLETKGGMATNELSFLDYDKLDSENINVVVIAGGAKKWDNDMIDESETSIFELSKEGYYKVKEQEKQNMGNYKTFLDFLNFVYENYKTDKYDLIIWDHGGAIAGAGYDELYNYDVLSLNDFEEALSNSPFNKDNKLEVVMFSTCLNGTIEVADTFKDYAEYLVASEEITQSVGSGSDFEFIHNIKSNDQAYDVAYKFVENYRNKVNNFYELVGYSNKKNYSTYSIVDLSNVEDLIFAVNDFFNDVDISSNFSEIARVRANVYQYNSGDGSDNMVDLYNLIDGLSSLSPDKADKVKEIFEKTIVYNWATNSKSRGLSIYFPNKSHKTFETTYNGIYSSLGSFGMYSKFIKSFDKMQNTTQTKTSYKDNSVSVDRKDGEADFEIELTKEQLKTYASAKYYVLEDSGDGKYKPIYYNGQATLDKKTLKANIKDKQLFVHYLCTDGSTGKFPVTINEIDADSKYIRYKTYAYLIKDEEIYDWKPVEITLINDLKNKVIEISDVFLINDDGQVTRQSVDINDYDYAKMSLSPYYRVNDNYELEEFYEDLNFDYIVYTSEMKFYLDDFDKNVNYYAIFEIEDIYGNSSLTDFIKMN